MMHRIELDYFTTRFPAKENSNPSNPSVPIKCSQLVENYRECAELHASQGGMSGDNPCAGLHRIALYCYKLEPKYFVEAANQESSEEYYLNLYIGKQMGNKQGNHVFKMKEL